MNRTISILWAFCACVVLLGLFSVERAWASSSPKGDATLTTNVVGNGSLSVTPDLPLYDYGESVTLNATPDVGWAFSNWSGSMELIPPWWNTYWPYRIALSVEANGVSRQDKLVEQTINFTDIFNQLGETEDFDENSIRVVQIDPSGAILNADVPFQFDKVSDYNATTNATGNVIFLMEGSLAENESRLYHLYFAPANNPYFVPSFTQLITSTLNGVSDEGEQSYKFETENATYFYHKNSGGFSSLNDADGNDWISYDYTVAGSGGAFRGIPNMIYDKDDPSIGGFHPGLGGSTSTILNSGPLKVSYHTVDGDWEALWEIYPDMVRMTLMEAEHNYWFLYEGTPGGALDSDDYMVLSDGTQYAQNDNWSQDMPDDEWAYFVDPDVGEDGRSLFFVHHEGDGVTDSYRRMNDVNGTMTVFGFGREGLVTKLSATPQQFTFGLIDEITYADAKPLIEATYKELDIFISSPEKVVMTGAYEPGSSTDFAVAMNMNRAITATFVPEYYTLDTFTVGNGSVELSAPINAQGYTYGEAVTVTATPDLGWYFDGWSGQSTAITDSLTITLSGSSALTATFEAHQYHLNLVQPSTGGTISASPSSATYSYNTSVDLSASPDVGYTFREWQGDFTGNQLNGVINITDNMTVTAAFDIASYEVTTDVVGQGQIELLPQQSTYAHGSSVDVVALPQEGWQFLEWSGGLSGNKLNETLTVVQPESITATFVPKQFVLAANTAGAGSVKITPQQDTYAYGSTVTLTATPDQHWVFDGWSGVTVAELPATTLTVTDNHEFTATFIPREYALSVLTQGSGSVTVEPSKESYQAGESVVITAQPDSGWILSQWEGDLSGDALTATVEIAGDTAIRAIFEEANIAIDTAITGNGQIVVEPQRALYEQGTKVTLLATPEPGWQFVSWYDGDESPTKIVEVRSGLVYTATFAKENYLLSVNIIGNGSISPNLADSLSYGDKVTLSAVPDDGWFFAGWQGAITGTEATKEITIVENTIVTATFTTSPYTVIADVNGGGTVTVDPEKSTYNLNEIVTLKAIADQGWIFSGWSGDLSGSNPTSQLAITKNHAVTATFVQSPASENIYLPLISSFK